LIDATGRLLRAPETLFDSAEAGHEAFGWNFPNVRLTEAFEAARAPLANLTTLEQALAGLEVTAEGSVLTLGDGTTLRPSLVVGADGKKSMVRAAAGFRTREHAFVQSALVCDLDLARPI